MEFQDNELSRDMFHSQAHIWNHIFSFINSMSLKCALELQIPDIMDHHGAPMPLSELVEALSINKEKSHFVHRLVRILVHSGFFLKHSISGIAERNQTHEISEERYSLTPASRFLLKEHPLSMRPYVLFVLDPIIMDPWQHMSKWYQNKDDDICPFQTVHGKKLWELASEKPTLNRLFNEAMENDSKLVIDVILKEYPGVFEGLDSIVDVGGGTGEVTKAISKAFPKLNCICFDLPHVVKDMIMVGNNNLSFVGGDMFEAIPNAAAVLLKWVLHGWIDEECIRLLKLCKKAIQNNKNGGKLIIIDMVVQDRDEGDESLETQLLFDMHMMTVLAGTQRNEKEWKKLLLDDAGFSDYKITMNLGLRSLIEVYP